MGIVQDKTAQAARFWSKVDRNGPVMREELGACWPWMGQRMRVDGRGRLWWKGRKTYAPRVAYELTYGPLPDGKMALHRCDYAPCCRPDHLYAGTVADNSRDMIRAGRGYVQHHRFIGDENGSKRHPERVARGERVGRSKLTEANVLAIRERHAQEPNICALARDYGVTANAIANIIHGRSWRHVVTETQAEVRS